MSTRPQRQVMVPPINQIFKYLQEQSPVNVWLYEQVGVRLTGVIKGFDEFMNVVLDDTVEVSTADPTATRQLGRILLKGDNITLISALE